MRFFGCASERHVSVVFELTCTRVFCAGSTGAGNLYCETVEQSTGRLTAEKRRHLNARQRRAVDEAAFRRIKKKGSNAYPWPKNK